MKTSDLKSVAVFAFLSFSLVNCSSELRVSNKRQFLMNSPTYRVVVTLPFSGRKISRHKFITMGFIEDYDLSSGAKVDYNKLLNDETSQQISTQGVFSKRLHKFMLSAKTHDFVNVLIQVKCSIDSLKSYFKVSKNIRKNKILTIQDMKLYLTHKQQQTENCLSEFVFQNNIKNYSFYKLQPVVMAKITVEKLLTLKFSSVILQINPSIEKYADLLSNTCHSSIPASRYYGQDYHQVGSIQVGLCGFDIIVAQVEFYPPETTTSCFNYGPIEVRIPLYASDPDSQYHANSVAFRMIGRANSAPSCPYPTYDAKNNVIYYGSSKNITLISANTIASADPAAFDWAHQHNADIFNVSMAQYNGGLPGSTPTHSPFNNFDNAADLKGDYQLPIMGAGNDPEQVVANAVFNGIIVGTFKEIITNEPPPYQIFPSSYNDLGFISTSSWMNPPTPHGDMHRPDVVVFESDGSSSLATPVVSALAAQLVSELPILRYNPITTKAIIMSTACISFGDDGSTPNRFFKPEKYGAGGISAPYAMNLVSSFYQEVVQNCGGSFCMQGVPSNSHKLGWAYVDRTSSGDFEVDSNHSGRVRYKWPFGQPTFAVAPYIWGRVIRVVLAWNHTPLPGNVMTDYDLVLQKLNSETGNWDDVSYSSSFDNNWEMIKYYHNGSTTETYRIEIVRYGSYSTPGTFNSYFDKIAWSTFTHENFHSVCK